MRTGLLVISLFLLAGCATNRRATLSGVPDATRMMGPPTVEQSERTIIRTAAMRVAVRDLAPARMRAVALVEAAGGTVDRETGMERILELRLRVPEARLDATLDSLARLGGVQHRVVTIEDHSVQAADLDARVRNLAAARDRLRALLDRAANVTEVVAVEAELARVQGELDGLSAQLAVLRGRAAMSTIDLTLERELVLGPLGVAAKGVGWVLAKLFIWR